MARSSLAADRRPQTIRSRGFTLIEVLAALVIVSLGMMAVIQAVSQTASNSTYLRDKTIAHWVAMNRLTEVRLEQSAPKIDESSDEVEMAGREWHWTMNVTQTPVETMRRIDINVRPAEAEEGTSMASITGFYGSAIAPPGAAQIVWEGLPEAGDPRNPREDDDGQPQDDADDQDDDNQPPELEPPEDAPQPEMPEMPDDAVTPPDEDPKSVMCCSRARDRRSKMRIGEQGFTLLEVLIAVAIFVIVGALAMGGYNELVKQSDIVETSSTRSRKVQSAIQRMVQDFATLEPRPVREPLGESFQPALRADARTDELAELTHSGWSNPSGTPRSTLQRVTYRIEDKELRREYWYVLDRTMSGEPVSAVLLEKVERVGLRFLDNNRRWHEQWPPLGYSGPDVLRLRPIAVEITVELEDWGEIKRLVEVAG